MIRARLTLLAWIGAQHRPARPTESPARAELSLCNRTSYRMDAALGLEKRASVATRGWFRLDPGQCRQVVDGPLDADMVYVHARTPSLYGSPPLPQNGESPCSASAITISNSPMRAIVRSVSRSISPRRGLPNHRKDRRSIWRKQPTTTTRKPASPASSGCSRSPATTPTRSTASGRERRKPRSRNSCATASCRRTRVEAGILRHVDPSGRQPGRRRILMVQ